MMRIRSIGAMAVLEMAPEIVPAIRCRQNVLASLSLALRSFKLDIDCVCEVRFPENRISL